MDSDLQVATSLKKLLNFAKIAWVHVAKIAWVHVAKIAWVHVATFGTMLCNADLVSIIFFIIIYIL